MKTKKLDLCMVFLIAFISRMVFILLFSSPLRTPMDELSTISTGAYFGGKDWTALTTFAKYYYGGGFTILFAPLFYLTDNANIIYTVMLGACALVQSINAPISYYIMSRYLKIENRKYLFIGSLACSFMVVTRAMEVFNEHIVIGCVWIVALLLCKVIEHGDNVKKKILYTSLLMFVPCYMLTTHARTQVVLIALVIVIGCYLLAYRKWLVHPVAAVIAGGISYFGAKQFNTMIKTVIWNWHEGMKLRNTEAKLDITLAKLKDPVNWEAIFSTIFGQTNTVLVFSGGIFALILVLLFFLYKDTLIKIFKDKKALLIKGEDGTLKTEPFYLVISVLFVMCVGAVMFAQCFTWLKRVVPALEGAYGTNAYGFKALTYVRYVGPFLGPVFMVGIAMIYHSRDTIKKYLGKFAALVIGLQFIWCVFILPHLGKARVSSEVYNAFSGYQIGGSEPMKYKYYFMATIVIIILLVVFIIFYYRKNVMVPLIIVTALLFYEYAYGAIVWDGSYSENFSSYADAGPDLVRQLEDEGYDVPETLYVVDNYDRSGIQRYTYVYQMLLNDYKVNAKIPKNLEEDNIVFSTVADYTELTDAGYVGAQLDDNEYLYVKGDSYISMFEAVGVNFK